PVTVERVAPLSRRVTVTFALWMTPLAASVTVPATAAEGIWARAGETPMAQTATAQTATPSTATGPLAAPPNRARSHRARDFAAGCPRNSMVPCLPVGLTNG